MMVVVPTSHQVTLHYASSTGDRVGQAITLVSLVVVVALALGGRRAKRARRARAPGVGA